MRLGLAVPQYDYSVPGEAPLQWDTVRRWSVAAEHAGYHSLWLADHLFMSIEKYGAPAGAHGGFEPLTTLAALARVTERVRLGTLVLCSQLRPATVLSKVVATLDVLSGGRIDLGLGAGWNAPEYEAAGIPFRTPGERLGELARAIMTVRACFAGQGPPINPSPLQRPGPPIWVGGRGDRLLRLVARHADGWNTVWRLTPEGYRERLHVLDRACEAEGRDPSTVQRSIGLYTLVGESQRDLERRFRRLQETSPAGVVPATLEEWSTGHLVGTVEQVSEQLTAWSGLGVSLVVTGFGAVPFAATDPDDLELVASAVP